MDAAAAAGGGVGVGGYIQEHPEMIQRAVNSCFERAWRCSENRGRDSVQSHLRCSS
jgi:hypothetical protein